MSRFTPIEPYEEAEKRGYGKEPAVTKLKRATAVGGIMAVITFLVLLAEKGCRWIGIE